jgi:hypothetical protein
MLRRFSTFCQAVELKALSEADLDDFTGAFSAVVQSPKWLNDRAFGSSLFSEILVTARKLLSGSPEEQLTGATILKTLSIPEACPGATDQFSSTSAELAKSLSVPLSDPRVLLALKACVVSLATSGEFPAVPIDSRGCETQ